MSKKRRPGRLRKVGRPKLKRKKYGKVGRPKKVGRPRLKRKRKYYHKLDVSVLYDRFKNHRKKIKDKKITRSEEHTSELQSL
jgi:hypothetical protein